MSTNSNNKLVHVNAYTKSDGTEVKEHYRGGGTGYNNSNGILESNGPLDVIRLPFPEDELPRVLEGRVEKNDYPSDDSQDTPSEGQSKAQVILKGIEIAASVAAELTKNLGQRKLTASQLNSSLAEIEKGQQKAIIRENLMLNYLTNTPNKHAYKRVYKQYMDLRRLNRENENLLSRIKYTVPRSGIESVTNELDNLNTNFDEISKTIREVNPLSINNKTISTRELPMYKPVKNPDRVFNDRTRDSVRNSTLNKKNYRLPKGMVDVGMPIFNYNNSMPDAAAMWEAASHDFRQSKDYVTKNGSLVYSINNLSSPELQNIVRQKVQGQMGVTNAPGLIFKSWSNLAKEIAVSPELKKYFLDNRDKLLNREVVKGGSTLFTSSDNLANSLGHADFVYTYIDTEGNLCSVVLDTYDFNKSDTSWKVQIANMAQELGTIRNYYVLIIVKTPEYIWRRW